MKSSAATGNRPLKMKLSKPQKPLGLFFVNFIFFEIGLLFCEFFCGSCFFFVVVIAFFVIDICARAN